LTIRVTPSARAELLETVVRLRQADRDEARRFVDRVEQRLRAIEATTEQPPELESPWRSAGAVEGHRLYLRERTDAMWLIAVWPEDRGATRFGG
jgi:hypothetical protein